jgi:Mce-associated membrane protein
MNSHTEQEATERAAGNLDGDTDNPSTVDASGSSTSDGPAPRGPAHSASRTSGFGRSPRFANPLLAWLTLATAFVLLCALAFGALWIFALNSDNRAKTQVRQQVLNAAEQGAINFTTLDYNHIQQSLDNWTNSSTGNLSQQFTSGQTVSAFETLMKQNKVVTSGHVQDATITDLEPTTATALVYILVDRNVGGKAQTPEYLPLACSLTLTNNAWKISDIGEPNNPFTGTSTSGNPAPSSSAGGTSTPPTSKSGQ